MVISKAVPLQAWETFYDWQQSQAITCAKGSFALAGMILTPLLAAVVDSNAHVRGWHAVLFVSGALIAVAAGLLFNALAAYLQEQYLTYFEDEPKAQPNKQPEPEPVIEASI